MNTLILSIAIYLFSVVSPEVATKIYLGLDSKDEAKADFALEMIEQTLTNPRLAKSGPAARLFIHEAAVDYLVSGASSIEAPVSALVGSKADFKVIACGKAVAAIRERMRSGGVKLIPGVEMVNDCAPSKKTLQKGGWFEVEAEGLY